MSAIAIARDVDGALVVTSETVSDGAGIQHASVLRLIDDNLSDFEDFGRVGFEIAPFATAGGTQSRRIALLNEQQATLLMTFQRNTDQVRAFKKELVKAFFEVASRLTPALPRSYADALRELAATVDQNAALEEKASENAPKVLFADSVATSDSTVLIGDLAKILRGNGVEIGANRLFALLREDGFLIRRRGSDWNMPTQRAMELGLFRVKETAITHSDGHVTVSKTSKVTGKGQQYFVSRYAEAVAV